VILDSSALLALIFREPSAGAIADLLEETGTTGIGAP